MLRRPLVSSGSLQFMLIAHRLLCPCPAVVLRGQGLQMMRDPVLGTVRTALDCWVGSIGMSEDTPVRLAKPCDTCPRDMTTLGVRSSNRSECIALPGYTVQEIPELNITVAVPCAQGSYKGGLGNEACTPCPSNTNTPSVGATSITQCTGERSNMSQTATSPSCKVNSFSVCSL